MKNNAPIEKDSEHENGNRDAVATTDNLALKDIIRPAANVQMPSTHSIPRTTKSNPPISKNVGDEPLVVDTELSTIENVLT